LFQGPDGLFLAFVNLDNSLESLRHIRQEILQGIIVFGDELLKNFRGGESGETGEVCEQNGEEIYRLRDRLNLLIENNTLKFLHGFDQGQ
jgi:hypothetical protein